MLNPADHTYQGCITKKYRESVTSILASMGYIDRSHYRDGYSDLGTNVHKLIDAYVKGWKFTAPTIYTRYLEPVKMFLEHTKAKIIGSEIEGEEPLQGYAGQLDWLVDMPGHGIGIMDIKVSQMGYAVWCEYQTEAYRQMLLWHKDYKDLKVEWRGGIMLGPDCLMPKLIPHNRIQGIDRIWQSIVTVYHDKKRHKIAMEKITKEEGWYE